MTETEWRGLTPEDLEPLWKRARTGGSGGQPDHIVDGKGRIVPNLANALHALRTEPALVRLFAFDQMACEASSGRAT